MTSAETSDLPPPGAELRARHVTVFGGARVQPDTVEYADAERLGYELASRGFTVVNGGYGGTMAAVSRGARRAGGRAVGVTVDVLAERNSPNEWLDEEVRTAALLQRIDTLIGMAEAYVVLPGGAGTLLELAAVWNLTLLGALHGKPIVVVGTGWRRVLQAMAEHLHTTEADLGHLTFVEDVAGAVAAVASRPPGS